MSVVTWVASCRYVSTADGIGTGGVVLVPRLVFWLSCSIVCRAFYGCRVRRGLLICFVSVPFFPPPICSPPLLPFPPASPSPPPLPPPPLLHLLLLLLLLPRWFTVPWLSTPDLAHEAPKGGGGGGGLGQFSTKPRHITCHRKNIYICVCLFFLLLHHPVCKMCGLFGAFI